MSQTTNATEDFAIMRHRLKSIFGGSIGNLIEWYDFYVYNFFALYFAKSFFPNSNPTVQLLNTFGIYALGFLIRPVGGWVLGVYADKAGRRAALTLSVTLMCAGSFLIAIAPTYAVLGLGAPILLLAARLIQGISLGGEYGTSATYLSEIAVSKHRGFYSSFQYVTLIGGQVFGSLTLLVMQQAFTAPELEAWGWRIPFAIGAALSVFGLYLRRNLEETEAFKKAAANPRGSLIRELFKHPKQILLVFGLTMGGTTAFYTYTTYMPTFLVNTVKLTRDQATQISFISLVIYAALQPMFGAVSDRIGRRPVLMWFGILGTLCTIPILTTLGGTHDYMTALGLIMAALLIVSGYTSINAVVKAELFPAGIRALGVGLPYAVAASVFGGTAPYVALAFKDAGHEAWFYWYVTVLIFLSLLVYTFMGDTKKSSHIDRD
ncbi:MAG: transporter, family, alpha-ketoglutarate permease [Acetobacteraceae bacterium]|nr:transporter, family, alpha-ketoglutarate permease [Acetobacteraceae bacterium]MEA2789284.1 transporter, family, alpha-ketoglutarate permease [Acetobacteraceae bacterium]